MIESPIGSDSVDVVIEADVEVTASAAVVEVVAFAAGSESEQAATVVAASRPAASKVVLVLGMARR
jgi:hypothetical protein